MIGNPDPIHVARLANEVSNPSGTCVIAIHPGFDGDVARVRRYLPQVPRPQYVVAWYWATTLAQYNERDDAAYADAMAYMKNCAQPTIDTPYLTNSISRKVSSAHKRMAKVLELEPDSVLLCITSEKIRVCVPDHITGSEYPPHAILAMALTELITHRAEEALRAIASA